jgi:hypothetical protein
VRLETESFEGKSTRESFANDPDSCRIPVDERSSQVASRDFFLVSGVRAVRDVMERVKVGCEREFWIICVPSSPESACVAGWDGGQGCAR